jgi:DMSO/TMAO reductase YedYZ molybdopterin-dependent catalytic subunit
MLEAGPVGRVAKRGLTWVERMLNRRAVIVGGLATLATAIPWVSAGRSASVRSGALRVVSTSPETLLTPPGEMFAYSEMRIPPAPVLTPAQGSMIVDGLVRRPLALTYAQLRGMPHEQHVLTLECFANAGGPLIFTTPFEGVPLAHVMKIAGVSSDATAARVETTDHSPAFVIPVTELTRPGTMLVAKMGGETNSLEHGGPYARLMTPGAGGNHDPKWIRRITFVNAPTSRAPEHPAPVHSDFLVPSRHLVGSLAGVTLVGFAFAGPEKVANVELSTDDGATYQRMPLGPQATPYVWKTWKVLWTPPARGFYVLRVRAATGAGGPPQSHPPTPTVDVGPCGEW